MVWENNVRIRWICLLCVTAITWAPLHAADTQPATQPTTRPVKFELALATAAEAAQRSSMKAPEPYFKLMPAAGDGGENRFSGSRGQPRGPAGKLPQALSGCGSGFHAR